MGKILTIHFKYVYSISKTKDQKGLPLTPKLSTAKDKTHHAFITKTRNLPSKGVVKDKSDREVLATICKGVQVRKSISYASIARHNPVCPDSTLPTPLWRKSTDSSNAHCQDS